MCFDINVPAFRGSVLHTHSDWSNLGSCFVTYTPLESYPRKLDYSVIQPWEVSTSSNLKIFIEAHVFFVSKAGPIFAKWKSGYKEPGSLCRTRERRWFCILFNFRNIF